MSYFLRPTSYILFFASLCLLLLTSSAQAQEPPTLERLLVEIWPEYDRRETLVIYRGELSADVELPASLTFFLPSYIDQPNAVAFEEEGRLVQIPEGAVTLQPDGADRQMLTFNTPTSAFHIEYYDPILLAQNGTARSLDYRFVTPYNTKLVTLEIQEPIEATDFQMTPPAVRTQTDRNNISYHYIDIGDLSLAESFAVQVSYQREGNATTLQRLGSILQQDNAELPPLELQPPPPDDLPNDTILLAYLLMAIGTVLLAASVSYWWAMRNRPATPQEMVDHWLKNRPDTTSQEAAFCHQCGAEFRAQAQFCHQCGAQRRQV